MYVYINKYIIYIERERDMLYASHASDSNFPGRESRGRVLKVAESKDWVFITGGCSGRGVQWMGVVLYSKTSI